MTEGCARLEVDLIVEGANHFGHPVETTLQNALDATLEGGGRDRAGAARSLELHLNDTGRYIGLDEDEIATVSLDARPHELNQAEHLGQALTALFIAQVTHVHVLGHADSFDLLHSAVEEPLPCRCP